MLKTPKNSALHGAPTEEPLGNAPDRIVGMLLDHIRNGDWKPGDRLPAEAELGRQTGASRTVVREALQQLKAMGVVRSRVGSGTFVANSGLEILSESLLLYSDRTESPQDWMELLEMRALIETESARRLARQGTPADIAPVWTAVETMRRSIHSLADFAEADVAFHQAVVAASGNRLFASVHRALLPMTRRFARATYRSRDQITANLREHEAIFESLLAHDEAGAANLMHGHLQASSNRMLEMFALRASSNSTQE